MYIHEIKEGVWERGTSFHSFPSHSLSSQNAHERQETEIPSGDLRVKQVSMIFYGKLPI